MVMKKSLRYQLGFFACYGLFLTSRIVWDGQAGWEDIIYAASQSLMLIFIVWFYDLKRSPRIVSSRET